MKIITVKLSDIDQNENSRVVYKSTDLSELMISMKKDGLLQPVGVREMGNGRYDAVFGNRRIVAAKRLGWEEIDAHIVEAEAESDRDIIGLIENLKRTGTSVSEDGRIFQKLVESGLTRSEIAGRLGLTINRVDTALDVFNEFPADVRALIVNKTPGKKRQGKVGASVAFQINNIRKTFNLNRHQTRALVNHARQDDVGSTRQLAHLAPLLKSGMEIQKALAVVSNTETVTVSFIVNSDHARKFEKKFGKSIHEALYERVEEMPDLKLSRIAIRKRLETTHESRKAAAIIRASESNAV